MSDLPSAANVVVIGSGIVGNSVVADLAELGWRDIVQLDKGPLPNPGGSTGHASNFIFPVDHNREMAALTLDSQRQYEAMGVNTTCGGIEVARKPERLEEFRRRMTSATAWGVDAELLTPEEVGKLVPFIDTDVVLGGFYTPSVSVVDSLRAGTIFRERAMELGALKTVAGVEVLGVDTDNGRVTCVVTDQGRIAAQYVVVACGVWSPRIAAMAGATIPLTPAVHQMIDVGPIPELEATGSEIGFPIVRDMDTFCYERQTGGSMEVGSYAHRPIFHYADDIPSIRESRLSPTELPFTADDFDQQLEEALELMPDILSTAEMKYAINGLLSLTPDGFPLLGETAEMRNLWSAAAVWIKEGPGVGRMIAEWMTNGAPEIDPHHSDITRFYRYARNDHHVRARCAEHYNKTYGIVHPREQWESERNIRCAPYHAWTQALGAEYFQAGGWERPHWYESNAPLVEHYGIAERPHEWDARWWSPIMNAEHLALREKGGMIDLAPFVIFDISGPGALDYLQHLAVNNCNVAVGRSIYTPLLDERGGFRSDLTIMRVADDAFRVVTGAFDGPRDEHWFRTHLPDDGSVTFIDNTTAFSTIGVWGPNARALMESIVTGDITDPALAYGATKEVLIDSITVRLFRISYVGEHGWEVYVPSDNVLAIWDRIWDAGQAFGMTAVGAGVYGTTGRLEKGYRLMGAELDGEYTPVEAGLARPKVKSADFIGKDAYLRAREEAPAAVLCTLTVENHTSARDGIARYMTGSEPILTLEGARIVDAKGRPCVVTSAGAGPSVGKYLLLAYLPPRHAVVGTDLLVRYMNEDYPVKVAVAGSQPLFDPDDAHEALTADETMSALRILACVKRVPAPGAQITLTADARAVDARNLAFTTSPHEECAVEEAIRLVEAHGGDITVLTVGPPEAEEQLRFAISVGAQHAVLATNDDIASGEDPDPQATAHAIAEAVRALEADGGAFDVLLFGNESADAGGFQVGVRVARALGRPMVNGIKAIAVADGVLTACRETDAGFEVYELALPAVIGVKEGINLPRYPTLPGRLRSKKAEVQTIAADAPSGGLTMVRFETPDIELTETEILGTGAAAAGPVVDLIYELGLA